MSHKLKLSSQDFQVLHDVSLVIDGRQDVDFTMVPAYNETSVVFNECVSFLRVQEVNDWEYYFFILINARYSKKKYVAF